MAFLVLYYGAMLALAFGWFRGVALRRFAAMAALLSGLLLVAQAFTLWNRASLTVLPLHGGISIHLKSARTFDAALVDCGRSNSFDAVLLPYLRAQGVNGIERLFLTHGDTRHVGAAPLVLQTLAPDELVVSPVAFRSPAYRQLLRDGIPQSVAFHQLTIGDQRADAELLYPPADLKVSRGDDGVMVLRIELRDCVIVLLSDLSLAGQRGLLDGVSHDRLRADVAVVGLPDTGEPLIPDLLEAVQPRLVIVADDELPPLRRAPDALLERLKTSVPGVCSTRQSGAITVTVKGRGWEATGPTGDVLTSDRD